MLYLNDGFAGGNTRFFDEGQQAYHPPDPAKGIATYVPRRGDALVFASEMMHDGEELRSGHKWILRSEVDLLDDGSAFVLRNVLSPLECDSYIAAAEQLGMKSVQAAGYERRVRI